MAAPQPPAGAGPDWGEKYAKNLELLIRHEQYQANQRMGLMASQGDIGDVKKQAQLRVMNQDPLTQKQAEMDRENLRLLGELLKAVQEQNAIDRKKRPTVSA
jgi:hypothetical protein